MNDITAGTRPVAPRRPAATATATLTVADGLRALEQGSLTCEAWARACLERIEERNAGVKAWVHVGAEAAIERARNLDRNGRSRPFDGVPIGLKDTIDTADMPTELGDPEIFPGRQPKLDAPVVTMARNLGFNVLGKNTVSRHAIMLAGPARNPHDLTRTPAASSAGSGAAVADFMTPLSIGTQTAGSILRPSAFCGAVGFKPTLDAVPYVGIRTYSRPLDVIGPICRSVEDATLFMKGFTGDPRFDTSATLRRDLRVGVWRTKDFDQADPAALAIFEGQLRKLEAAGATVRTLAMPAVFDGIGEAQDVIMAYDLAREYADIKRNHAEKCDRELIDYLELGESYSAADYAQALDAADRCRRAYYDVAGDVDVIVMPSTLGEAPEATSTGSSAFIRIWSLLHNPSITLPAARGPAGLPLGFQVVGCVKEDARLLYHARCIESILGSTAHLT